MAKVGLVLEGGAMRGMFTAGVLDVLLENNIEVDGIIGVSAGAVFGVNYFSKQKGRVIRYSKRFCNDKRYISKRSYLLTGNIVNKKFAYYKVSLELDPFDNETFMKTNKDFYAVVTNVETGKPEYISIKDCIKDMEYLRASSAVPLSQRIVKIGKKKYLDGAVGDSVPLSMFKSLGYDKIIVVETRTKEFRKQKIDDKLMKMYKRRYRHYKSFLNLLENKHTVYNDVKEQIIELENNKEIIVIRPPRELDLDLIERNPDKLQKAYDDGIQEANKNIKRIKKFIK